MSDFHEQVALISGSSDGIGKYIAEQFAAEGAHVIINSRSTRGREVAESLCSRGLSATFIQADVASPAECRTLIDAAVEKFQRLDVLVNNAGNKPSTLNRTIDSLTDDDLSHAVHTHLHGPFNLCIAAWPHMASRRYGRILNIVSGHIFGSMQDHGLVPFSIAKAGIVGLTKTLAQPGATDGILVNALFPAALDSNWNRVGWPPIGDEDECRLAEICSKTSLWPFVKLVCSRDISITGEMFSVCNENITRVFVGDTENISYTDYADMAKCLAATLRLTKYDVPASIGHFFGKHLGTRRRLALVAMLRHLTAKTSVSRIGTSDGLTGQKE